jgi:hypothetical protein
LGKLSYTLETRIHIVLRSSKKGGNVGRGSELDLGAVVWGGPGMGRALVGVGFGMLEPVQHGWDVSRHRDVHIFVGVIPADGEAVEQCAAPILGDRVELTKGPEEVLGMLGANVFDAEIVNDEGEGDGTSGVGPKRGGAGNRGVAKLGETKGEAIVGDVTGLFEAGHPLPDLHVDPSIGGGKSCQIVLLDDFSRKFGDVQLHVLIAGRGGAIVKMLDIERTEACAGC